MNADALAAHLLELLDRDDIDAAIEAGLAGFDARACQSLPAAKRERLAQARSRLLEAWAARDRHGARNARLARRAEDLRARRQAGAPSSTGPRRTTLPPAAAAALARARERAGGSTS